MLFAQVQDVTLVSAREMGGGGGGTQKRSGFARKHYHPVVKALLELGLEGRWAQAEAEFRCQE